MAEEYCFKTQNGDYELRVSSNYFNDISFVNIILEAIRWKMKNEKYKFSKEMEVYLYTKDKQVVVRATSFDMLKKKVVTNITTKMLKEADAIDFCMCDCFIVACTKLKEDSKYIYIDKDSFSEIRDFLKVGFDKEKISNRGKIKIKK